jgi:hypothetical protein
MRYIAANRTSEVSFCDEMDGGAVQELTERAQTTREVWIQGWAAEKKTRGQQKEQRKLL